MTARPGAWLAGLGLLLLVCVLASRLLLPPGAYGDLDTGRAWQQIICRLLAGAVYLGAVALVLRLPIPRAALLLALGAGLAARLLLLAAPPVMSTDLYRYVWDGKVQAAGINPYLYIPADPALTALRDHRTGPDAIFVNINRPETAPTIYPPAAQMLFAGIGLLAPSIWTVKAVMTALDLLAGLAAWRLLRAAGRPDATVLVWAWNPLLIWEFAGAGHIDAAAVAASGLALLLAVRRRPGAAGAALGVAVLCKLLPAALAPAIWRPRGWRAPVAAILVIAAGYACYASAGWRVFGYLPGYAKEEGLEAGNGFLLLRLLALFGPLPGWAAPAYVAAALLLLLGARALDRGPARSAPRGNDRARCAAPRRRDACHAFAALSVVSDRDRAARHGRSAMGGTVADSRGAAPISGPRARPPALASRRLPAGARLAGDRVAERLNNA